MKYTEAVAERSATLLKRRLWHKCFPKFCEISKNNFSYRTPPVGASEYI